MTSWLTPRRIAALSVSPRPAFRFQGFEKHIVRGIRIKWWVEINQIDAFAHDSLSKRRKVVAVIGNNDYAALWTTLQRLLPQFKGKEYTDFPRGRVLFDSMEGVFLVYSSRGIVNNPDLKKMILAEFNLPLTATKFAADYHYENVIPPMLDEDFD